MTLENDPTRSGHTNHSPTAADADRLPLTAAMRSMWLQEQFDPSGVVNHLGHTFRIAESVDADLLADVLQDIVDCREVLRYTLTVEDGEPFFVPHDHIDVDLRRVAAEQWTRNDFEEFVRQWTFADYDLERGPLFRFALVDHGHDEHSFVFAMHHLVSDLWSMTLMMSEIGEAFQRRSGSNVRNTRPDRFALREQLAAERNYLDSEQATVDLAYWRDQLADLGDPVLIPTDRPRGPEVGHRGGMLTRVIDADRSARIREFAKEYETTPFVTMLAIYHVLLCRYTGRTDIDVSTVRAACSLRSARSFGCFVDGIVLRTRSNDGISFCDLLTQVDDTVARGFEHGSLPLQEVIEHALEPRSGRPKGISRLGYVWQKTTRVLPRNLAEATAIGRTGVRGRLGEWEVETDFVGHRTSPQEISLLVAEIDNGFAVSLEYMRDLIDETTADQILRHFDVLLESALTTPSAPILRLTIMGDVEVAEIIATDTGSTPLGRDGSFEALHRRIARTAATTPDSVAIRCGANSVTYGELSRQTQALAGALDDRGVRPGDLVGVLIPRSIDTIVAVLGVLEAGAVYVPLDPTHPAARIGAMLSDAAIETVVTRTDCAARFEETLGHLHVVQYDDVDLCGVGSASLRVERTADDLAYVTFTSGSTGRAKGVQVDHGNLADIVDAMTSVPGFDRTDVVMAVANVAFDMAVVDIFVTLSVGAQLVIADSDTTVDGRRLRHEMEHQGITLMQATPTTWSMLIDAGWKGSAELRILSGGEPLPSGLADRLADRCGELWNMYGPAEVSVWATCQRIGPHDRPVPIGRPIDNTALSVLDEHQQPVPNGVTGELYITGRGVTRGYLNQPELTNTVFTPDPHQPHQRRYRTGDLVRRDHNGTYYHLGRIDNQIKLRGHRIELGEIEATLNTHPHITNTVVTTYTPTDNDTRIAAYITTDNTNTTTDDIRAHAAKTLPAHMIPTTIIQLDHFPLTPNNKIDRARLPQPTTTQLAAPHEPPHPGLETRIATIWQHVLDTTNIGRHDDFFQLGGHSLLATKIASRLRSACHVDLDVRSIFDHPCVASLATHVEAAAPIDIEPVATEAPADGKRRLSFAQEQMWFLNQLNPAGAGHNVAGGLHLRGTLDVAALRHAIDRIVYRHVGFRTVFGQDGSVPYQRVVPHSQVSLDEVDLSADLSPLDAMNEAMVVESTRPFDLTRPPLARFVLYRVAPDEHGLLVVIHHVLCDHWSLGVLAREITSFYAAELSGDAPSVVDVELDADVYAHRLRDRLDGPEYERQLDYWRAQLDGVEPLELPTDRPRTGERSTAGETVRCAVPADVMSQVEEFSRSRRTSPFVVFLAVYQILLRRYSRQTDIAIGTAVASRSDSASEDMVAMLVNTVVIRAEVDDCKTFDDWVTTVHELALEGRANGDVPFLHLVAELALHRDQHRQPLAQVFFNLRNTPFELPAFADVTTAMIDVDRGAAHFDLSLAIDLGRENVARFTYLSELFDRRRIESMFDHYWALVRSLTTAPADPIAVAKILTESELRVLQRGWDDHVAAPEPSSAPDRFRDTVARHPDRTAVRTLGGGRSYLDVGSDVDRLAIRLRDELGVAPGDRIGVHLDTSFDVIVAIQSLWTLGAVYVPLDPADPVARIDFIARDARLSGIITAVPGTAGVLNLPTLVPSATADPELVVPPTIEPYACRGHDLAYIIYTSGSTGSPKGVAVEHRNLANLVESTTKRPGISHHDVVLAATPTVFDASIRELVVPLAVGAEVVPVARCITRDATQLADALTTSGATIAKATPTTWSMLIDAGWKGSAGLRVLAGGEPLSRDLADRLLERSAQVWNVYGPTEATVNCTVHRVLPGDGPVPIGRPIDNTALSVLDEHQQPVPNGVTGELYITGRGVTRGYLNQPELTNTVFTPDPHQPHQRRYRTGDLVRRDHNGTYYHLGRIDNQIKLRGHRIELGEIEATLNTHPHITNTVVTTYTPTDNDTRIAAYITTDNTNTTTDDIRAHAAKTLPAHMIPTTIIQLDHFPLTPNNKIDRARLPQPTTTQLAAPHEPPHPGLETRIATIWQHVLDTTNIGRHDDFFQLGGHSLLALKAFGQLAPDNPGNVPLSVMFRAPTIASLATALTDEPVDRGWTSLVEINAAGARPPFFYVSPFMISVLAFSHLGRHLGLDQPVYCLQPQGLEQDDSIHSSVEEMAAHYLTEIRQVQPVGPYFIGGHCSGSIVAFEMTRQLQAAGEHVQLLLLVDSRPPNSTVFSHSSSKSVPHLIGRVRHYARTGRLADSLVWTASIVIDQVWVRRAGDRAGKREATVRSVHSRAHSQYETEPIAGGATLIRSQEWSSLPDKGWHLRWSELLGGTLQVKTIPGTHAGLVENSNSEALARCISESIAESIGRSGDQTPAAIADAFPHRTAQPIVSVVIPTFNRCERLSRVLHALAGQSYPDDLIEVVVVSDGSTDGTAEYLTCGHTPLPVVAVLQDNAGPAVARNRGVDIATGDLVVFIDDDVVPTRTLIAEHVASHARSSTDIVVMGPMLTPSDHQMSPWVRWEQAMLDKQYEAMRKGHWTATARQFYTGNASLSRALFAQSGGFDESFRRAEDVELAYRLEEVDVAFEMNLDAIGYHYAIRSFDSWTAIASAYGSANVVFGRDRDRPDLLRTIARDYRRRNPLNRLVSWLGVRSDRFAAVASSSLLRVASIAKAKGFDRINRYALSGIYNIAYCRGVAAELGGAREFGRFVRRHHPLLNRLARKRTA